MYVLREQYIVVIEIVPFNKVIFMLQLYFSFTLSLWKYFTTNNIIHFTSIFSMIYYKEVQLIQTLNFYSFRLTALLKRRQPIKLKRIATWSQTYIDFSRAQISSFRSCYLNIFICVCSGALKRFTRDFQLKILYGVPWGPIQRPA